MLETQWQQGLTEEGAARLCGEAILAGIFNDLGSGSNVDVCIITPEKVWKFLYPPTEFLLFFSLIKGS